MQKLEQLLLDALNPATLLAEDRLAGLTPEQWQAWIALAKVQRVTPLLWHRLRQKKAAMLLPAALQAELKASLTRTAMQNLRRYGELRRFLTTAQENQIPVLLLKGIYLADAVYGNAGLREMTDIDLLVPAETLQRTASILIKMGYEPLQPICPELVLKTNHHLPPLVRPGYANFEIHWNLMDPDEPGYVGPEGFLQRAVPVQVAGCGALALSPEDLLLHLCYHTSFHHHFAFGLRPSCDIAAVIEHFGMQLDWQVMTERAAGLGWQRGVYLALRLARDLVGAAVPEKVLKGLQPVGMQADIVELARRQIFSEKEIAREVTISFAQLAAATSLAGKMRIFWQRVFLTREQLAVRYELPTDSRWLYACYPRRVFDLLRNNSSRLRQIRRGDQQLSEIVTRKKLIVDWLGGAC